MSFKTEKQARDAAKRTRDKMANPSVWENLGWHARLRCGTLDLNINRGGNGHLSYWCRATNDPDYPHGDEIYWQDVSGRNYRRPQTAVDAKLERMHEFIKGTLVNWTELRRSLALPLAKGGSAKRSNIDPMAARDVHGNRIGGTNPHDNAVDWSKK